jgi:hypothetical protein
MILGAFGDSFIYGSDLSDIQDDKSQHYFFPSHLTYPAVLAQKFNMDYYCTALPCQGNKVIADDILRAVIHHGKDMFYVISWSWIDRFEFQGLSLINSASQTNASIAGWETVHPGRTDKCAELYYKNFYSDLDAKLSNLMYINTALEALLDNKCKFLMTYMDHLLFDKQWHCTASIDYLQNKIMKHATLFNGKTFLEWSRDNNFPESENWHPLELAHEKAAEYMLPVIHHSINTRAKEDYLHAFK